MKPAEITNFTSMHCTSVDDHLDHRELEHQLDREHTILATNNHPAPTRPEGQQQLVENIMPGIFLTKNFIAWNKETLLTHGFTHIIIIDKHIQELYYPSSVAKVSAQAACDFNADCADSATQTYVSSSQLNFGEEFEAIDLNFGEKSYLTTVLPNCYRAVKFINKALKAGGTILVIDCNGGEQKCVTIIVAYLMFKYNINFNDAFSRLKEFYKKADLDRFYKSQLYEYEPILQVQRAQSRGHSCSRELHSALLKRKKMEDHTPAISDSANSFLHTMNPLNQFHAQQSAMTTPTIKQTELQRQTQQTSYVTRFHDWYDYIME